MPRLARSRAGARLAEQLAPELLAGEHREQVALLLLRRAGEQDGRPGPADADRVDRPPHPGPAQLVVDDQLVDRVGVEAPRRAASGGRRSRPRPAAARSGGGGRPATPAPRPGGGRPRREARSPRGDRRRAGASWHRAPGRHRAGPPEGRGGTVGSNARLELRRHLGGVADRLPDAPAQVQGDRRSTWAEFDRRADGVAATLLGRRRRRSRTRWRTTSTTAPSTSSRCSACSRPALVPVNTNYRYGDDELVYLWDNADAVAVVFHGTFTDRVERHPRPRAERPRRGSGSTTAAAPCPEWADPVRGGRRVGAAGRTCRAVGPQRRRPLPPLHRRHDRHAEGRDVAPGRPLRQPRRRVAAPVPARAVDWDALAERLTKPGPVNLPAAPLMHGTGAFNAMWNLCLAGSVVTLDGPPLRRRRAARHLERERVNVAVDRRRRLRQADPARARRRARPLGPLQPAGHRLVGRDVERRDQGRPAAPQPAADHDRLARLVGGDRHGQRHHDRGRRPRRRPRSASGRTRGCSTDDGRDVEPGLGRARPGGAAGPDAGRLLQGPGEVGGHVRRSSTASATRSRATGPRSRPTARSSCSAGAASASTPAARRSTPRRSRRC